jgi:hypothetical protein
MTQVRIGKSVACTGGADLRSVAGRAPGQRTGAACALGTFGRNLTRLSAVRKSARRYPYSRSCGANLGACGAGGGEGMMRSSIGTPSWTTASSIRTYRPPGNRRPRYGSRFQSWVWRFCDCLVPSHFPPDPLLLGTAAEFLLQRSEWPTFRQTPLRASR